MDMELNEILKMQNQIAFPLYACSKEVIKQYRPFLDEIGLTYTQYIAMLVLMEEKACSLKDLGKKLFLDSGTLTPMLKNLESKGFVKRTRSSVDERVLEIKITKKGESLKDKADEIYKKLPQWSNLNCCELKTLHNLLNKLLEEVTK